MKLTRIMPAIMILLLIVIGAAACTLLTAPHSETLETNIYAYLEEKYPDLEFEIKSYTQDTYTSGKYVFQVFCKTTEIDFQIYQSSFLTTDSYTVTYANQTVGNMLLSFFEESLPSVHIKSVQWLDLYADGNTGYKFRDVDLSQLPDTVSEIESIYRIELLSEDTADVTQALRSVAEILNSENVPCDKISFEWVQADYAIIFNTNMLTLNSASDEQLAAFLTYVEEAKQSDEIITVSYLTRIKYVGLFLDEIEDEKTIPGFGDPKTEEDTAKK